MFILKDKSQLENAIAKARKIKPRVRMIAFGVYVVKGSNGDYTVRCERTAKGESKFCAIAKAARAGLSVITARRL